MQLAEPRPLFQEADCWVVMAEKWGVEDLVNVGLILCSTRSTSGSNRGSYSVVVVVAGTAAAAAVASVVSDSVRPHRRQPTRLLCPWDSPGKNTGVGCHFLLQCMKVKSESEVAQSCPTLSDPMDCSLPGSSIHGIFQARVLEWGASAFSRWQGQQYY